MARSNQTADWANRLSPSLGEIKSLAIEAYAHLPETFRAYAAILPFRFLSFLTNRLSRIWG